MENTKLNQSVSGKVVTQKTRKTWWGKDVLLNVGVVEGFIRIISALLLAFLLMILPQAFLWVIVPVSAYLFSTGLTHYCFFKHFWMHTVLKKPLPTIDMMAKELDVPEDEI